MLNIHGRVVDDTVYVGKRKLTGYFTLCVCVVEVGDFHLLFVGNKDILGKHSMGICNI